jgi:hypothetical protein
VPVTKLISMPAATSLGVFGRIAMPFASANASAAKPSAVFPVSISAYWPLSCTNRRFSVKARL